MPHADTLALILTGAPGSGKTTVARVLARTKERAVHLESDLFFRFISSGYIPPWKPESHEQNTAVMQAIGETAATYAQAGYFTIVDGIISPRWFLRSVETTLLAAGVSVGYAVLRPDLAVAQQRAAGRSATRLADPDVIRQLWEDFADLGVLESHALDSSTQTADETAASIGERLTSGALLLRRP